MADIWSEIGVDIDKDEGEWLYKIGSDVRGPMPHRMLVGKLLEGVVDLDTLVAREGTDFHPIYQVAAFAPHLENARQARARREARRTRKTVAMFGLPLLLILVGLGLYLRMAYHKRLREQARAQQIIRSQPLPPPPDNLPKMDLVALVTLGEAQIHNKEVPVTPPSRGKRKERKRTSGDAEGPSEPAHEEPAEEVQTCKLSQSDLLGTLRGALGKLNVCVEDEKKRDAQGLLPPTLELQFVVKPSGKVSEFVINDRHYRTGPLNNCMIKAFNSITFPSSNGANCPITIPIKIGK